MGISLNMHLFNSRKDCKNKSGCIPELFWPLSACNKFIISKTKSPYLQRELKNNISFPSTIKMNFNGGQKVQNRAVMLAEDAI